MLLKKPYNFRAKVNWGLEGTSDIMLTPKLGAASISNVQFMDCNSQLLGAGRAQTKITVDPLRVIRYSTK